MRHALIAILAALSFSAAAQPVGVDRVLRNIDFEERRLGNNEALPMHWVKVEAAGFPHYVNGHLASDQAHGGEYSFRFDLNGGSVVYRYEAKQISVNPNASYRIEAWVRTTVLEHARARVTGYLTDLDGHPLVSSVRHSELYTARITDEPWKKLSFDLTSLSPQAAYLIIELELLQPEIYAESSLGQHTLYPQDIHGSAWFDDVTVSQIPRVNLTTGHAGNLFRRGEPIELSMEIHDAFTDDLTVQMIVRDAAGKVVHQRSGIADMTAHGGKSLSRSQLLLPDLPAGWYEVAMSMSSQGQPLGVRSLNLVRLNDDAFTWSPDERFGLIATDLPFESWTELPGVLPYLGVGRVKLGVWSKTADAERINPEAFDIALGKLRELQIRPTACLLDLPPAINRKIDEHQGHNSNLDTRTPAASWMRLLKARDEDWHPPLEDLIARHATHLDRWQIGPDGSDLFVTRPGMREVYAKVYAEFASLIRKPDLAMPWPAWYELDRKLASTVAVTVPSSVLPHQLPLYMQDLRSTDAQNVSLTFQLLDRDKYGRDVQVRDMAQRIIYALSANADRIDLPHPFTTVAPAEGTDGDTTQQPQDLFPILRTVLTTLGHAKFVGRVPIADGIEAFLFDRSGQGILVLWDNGRAGTVRQLPINLGDSPRMMDLLGNEIPLVRPVNDPITGTVQLVVGPMPVFLTNIDGPLAQLRASVALDRPLIDSTSAAHMRHIRFKNTYPIHITGSFKLKAPARWSITPSIQDFALNPGEVFDREVSIEFPLSSPAGPRTIDAEFFVQSEKATKFTMPLAVKLGLTDLGMQTLALRDGPDVVIQQIIQNYSDKSLDYNAFAIFPGRARQERLVAALGPGQSTVKRYRFNDVTVPKGSMVRVGVKEIDGSRLLNDEIEVP
jgi:hypothetical protein